jgi:DNA-binding transcriptional regulator YbjK
MPSPGPDEVWRRLVDEAGEELIEGAVAVSVEQAERDLRAAGFDVEAARRAGEAVIARLLGSLPKKST